MKEKNMKNKSQKSITKNYIYNLFYQILSIITPLITTPYVSRVLGAEGVGAYSYGLSIVTYFNLFGCLGLSTYGQLEIAKKRNNKDEIKCLFNAIATAKFITMSLSIAAYFIMLLFASRNKDILIIMLLSLITTMIDISWYFQGIEDFEKIVLRNSVVKIIGVIFIFLFVHKSTDLYKYIILLQTTALISNLSMWPYVVDIFGKVRFVNLNLKNHWKGSMIYFIPSLATTVYTVLDKSMIGWITNSNLENGYYEQAHKIEQVVIVVLTSFSGVFLPRMAFLFENGFEKEIKNKLNFSISFIICIALPMMCGLMAVADDLIPLFLGENFLPCVPLLKIFSLLIFAIGLNNAVGMQCLMPCGRQKQFNIGVVCGAFINFILNVILINCMGAVGAAISTVVAEFVILLFFVFYARDYINLREYVKPIMKYGWCSIVMMICLEFLKAKLEISWLNLGIEVIIGCVIYFGLLLFTRDRMIFVFIAKIKEKIKRH